jgi:hypothetical protein
MLKKFAVALIAASFLTAPALAQGSAQPATASQPAGKSLAKPVLAKPALIKTAKHVKHHKRHTSHVALRSHKVKVSKHLSKGKHIHTARAVSVKPAIRSN